MLRLSSNLALPVAAIAATALAAPLAHAAPAAMRSPAITQAPFGALPDGQITTLYTLRNARGSQVQITNYGGIVTAIRVPDKNGVRGDVVLGFPTVDGYLKNSGPYFGALIGRYANRIAGGRFTLDGKTYQLAKNNGVNHLHGGIKGFDKQLWNAKPMMMANGPALELTLFSPAGQNSYPGNVNVRVRYTWENDDELRIDYRAVTDAPTVLNLTNHSYFNLRGAGLGNILDHRLKINADRYTPIDATSIPLGNLAPVAGTPFDFRAFHPIGQRIGADNAQLKNGQGYDHNFVLRNQTGRLKLGATAYEPTSGRELRFYTTEPGVQLYSGNFITKMTGKYGRTYDYRTGFCLEAQHYPDSPNQPSFPSTTLRPGQTYSQTTVYRFSTR